MPLVLAAILAYANAGTARAQDNAADLSARLTPAIIQEIFPGATRVDSAEGVPPAAAVYVGENLSGYIFSTLDVVAAVGYTTTPIDVVGGVTSDGMAYPAYRAAATSRDGDLVTLAG